jgi:hypothetical protein
MNMYALYSKKHKKFASMETMGLTEKESATVFSSIEDAKEFFNEWWCSAHNARGEKTETMSLVEIEAKIVINRIIQVVSIVV